MTADPDPGHMERYCQELLPRMLIDGCGASADDAQFVAQDVTLRAEAAARLDHESREILAGPFLEESFDHKPDGSPVWAKAVTTLVIRNSRLEELHTNGRVGSRDIQAITTYGSGPLSHLLVARRRQPLPTAAFGEPFSGLANRYPRAWACLAALRDALNDGGGRLGYRAPNAPVPVLPGPDEIVQAPTADHIKRPSEDFDAVVFSAIDPRFDQTALTYLQDAARGDGLILGLSALSRISRNSNKLLRVMEFLLAHKARIMTTNYLLGNSEVWVRRRQLVKPDSRDSMAGFRSMTGLSGAHRKTVEQYVRMVTKPGR